MGSMKRHIFALALLLPALCDAQAVWQVTFRFQPTMLAPQGLVTSCGIRFLGLGAQAGKGSEVDVVDGSIAIHKSGFATVKAGYLIGDLANPTAAKTRASGRNISWLRVGDGAPLSPADGKVIPGEDPGYVIYSASVDDGLTSLTSMLAGSPILLSFKNAAGATAIFNGASTVDEDTRQQFLSCVDKLLADSARK